MLKNYSQEPEAAELYNILDASQNGSKHHRVNHEGAKSFDVFDSSLAEPSFSA